MQETKQLARAFWRWGRNHRVFVVFLIVVVGGFFSYQRQSELIDDNRALIERIDLEAKRSDEALCQSRVEARDNLGDLLKSIVADFVPGRPELRAEITRRIDDYLGDPPEGC